VWLVFLGCLLAGEVFWRGAVFPADKTPNLGKYFIRSLVIFGVFVLLFSWVFSFGFTVWSTRGLSLRHSIGGNGFWLLIFMMPMFYGFAAIFVVFGSLGLRYLLARKFGWFVDRSR
jgi:hypothetical protein